MALQMMISFKTHRVHGTDRGGEDLFFKVEAFCSGGFKGDVENALLSCYRGERDPELLKAFEEAWEVALTNVPLIENDCAEEEFFNADGADLYVRDGHLRSGEGEYDFSVDWSLERAKEKVYEAVIGKNWAAFGGEWVYSLKSSQFRLNAEIFVDGNAD